MKLVSSYKTITIETSMTAKDLKTVRDVAPEATVIYTEDKTPIFSIGIAKSGVVKPEMVVFDNETANGSLYVTVMDKDIPESTDARQAFIEENFGSILVKLAKVEQQVADTLTAQAGAIATIASSITIL